MITDIQPGTFSHCRCQNCGYFAEIEKFNKKAKVVGKSGTLEAVQVVYICPLCDSEFTEAYFPNEIN